MRRWVKRFDQYKFNKGIIFFMYIHKNNLSLKDISILVKNVIKLLHLNYIFFLICRCRYPALSASSTFSSASPVVSGFILFTKHQTYFLFR